MKASEITIAEGDEESSSDDDDEDDDDDDDDETVNDRDETESVTVGEDEEKAVDVLETIEEEKVGPVRLDLHDPGLTDTRSGHPPRTSGCIHGRREGLDTVP